MKIFISWSGDYSKAIAEALNKWLGLIFSGIPTFISTEDIRKGSQWRAVINKALEECNFGIACLTPDNRRAEWIMYESGALSKLPDSALYTLLIGLKPSEFHGTPLDAFNHTLFNKDDFFKLVKAINEVRDGAKHTEENLKTQYDTFFHKLQEDVDKAAKLIKKGVDAPPKKSVEEMFEMILENTNALTKSLNNQQGQVLGVTWQRGKGLVPQYATEVIPRLTASARDLIPFVPITYLGVDDTLKAVLFEELNIQTFGEIMQKSGRDLLKVGYIDESDILVITQALAQYGLTLRPNIPDLNLERAPRAKGRSLPESGEGHQGKT